MLYRHPWDDPFDAGNIADGFPAWTFQLPAVDAMVDPARFQFDGAWGRRNYYAEREAAAARLHQEQQWAVEEARRREAQERARVAAAMALRAQRARIVTVL